MKRIKSRFIYLKNSITEYYSDKIYYTLASVYIEWKLLKQKYPKLCDVEIPINEIESCINKNLEEIEEKWFVDYHRLNGFVSEPTHPLDWEEYTLVLHLRSKLEFVSFFLKKHVYLLEPIDIGLNKQIELNKKKQICSISKRKKSYWGKFDHWWWTKSP